jgi:hypothetical protein
MLGKITIYKHVTDTATTHFKDVSVAIDRIKTGKSKVLVEKVRAEQDEEKQKLLKNNLPGYCFSGKFRTRHDSAIIEHSGLVCLDFDKMPLDQIQTFKDSICDNEFTYCCFISPSGNGVKVLVKIPKEIKHHRSYFKALKDYFKSDYWDDKCINISRFCFESYDAEIFVNEDSLIWSEKDVDEVFEYGNTIPILPVRSSNEIITKLQVWFNRKFGATKGSRNNNLFVYANALNEYGIPEYEAQKHLCSYAEKDFTEKEIITLIKSAYKKTGNHATKYFEDAKTKEWIERQFKSGVEKKKIVKQFTNVCTEDDIDNVITELKEVANISEFWFFDDKGKCHVSHYDFKVYLEQQGFYKLYPSESNSFIFIKIENNLIENTSNARVKDYVLKYLEQQKSIKPYELAASSSKLFKDDYLNLVEEAKISFFEDTIDTGVFFYKNGALKIDKSNVELIDYLDVDGYVWKEQVINRNFIPTDAHNCVFEKFLLLVCDKDDERLEALKSVIGYLLHSFKTSANNKAIIINDETISDNPNGGSGKGLFWNAIKHMKNVVDIDGKQFDFNKSFIYQRVNADTQLLVFDDVRRNFEFENLFSLITEGITIERKNKDAIKIPIEKSPKILITTNYTVGGIGGSFDRRKWEIEFSSYFNSLHTPLKEFGHLLFDEWDELEWCKFDNLMIGCLQLYLSKGLIKQEFKNLELRKLQKETSLEFIEWCDEGGIALNTRHKKSELFDKFLTNYQREYSNQKWFTIKLFIKWIESYGRYKGYKVSQGNSNGMRWINISDGGITIEPIEEDAPF